MATRTAVTASKRVRRCSHFRAVRQPGAIEARQLPDGRWEYTTLYRCPDCLAAFRETHYSLLL